MKHLHLNAIWLVALCLLAMGCGDAGVEPAAKPDVPSAEKLAEQAGEILVESSEPTVFFDDRMQDASGVIKMIIAANPVLPADQYTVRLDEALSAKHQLRFWVEPTDPKDRDAINRAADQAYEDLVELYKAILEKEMIAQLDSLQGQTVEASKKLKALQQSFSAFQEARRGTPQTSDSRMERRKFDLAIKNALNEQIELDQQIRTLQKRLDRGQFPTLLRIR